EKPGLERVFRLHGIAEHASTHAQHHRPMPAHDCRESRLVLLLKKSSEQASVGGVIRADADAADEAQDRMCGAGRHDVLYALTKGLSTITARRSAGCFSFRGGFSPNDDPRLSHTLQGLRP